MPLVSALVVVDLGTGECLNNFIDNARHVSGMSEFRRCFPLNIDVSTADRDKANDRAEAAFAADVEDHSRLTLPCIAHICSTMQSHAFGLVGQEVSGAIVMSLTMKSSGAVARLREQIAEGLEHAVVVHDAAPPPADDPRVLYRDAVLKTTSAGDVPCQKLAERIKLLVNGEWEPEKVDYYAPGLQCARRLGLSRCPSCCSRAASPPFRGTGGATAWSA